MKQRFIMYLVLVLILVLISGCQEPGGSNNNNNKDEFIGGSQNNTDKVSPSSSSVANSYEQDSAEDLLQQIKELAGEGKIPGCEFRLKTTCIGDVESKWGKADHTEYIPEAKGSFATYISQGVVFGFNKGLQIFDIRFYDKKLNEIRQSNVYEVYGKADMTRTYNGEDILGYIIGDEFKIRFIFPAATDEVPDPFLDHISIFYPQGTVNSMADDPGIEW